MLSYACLATFEKLQWALGKYYNRIRVFFLILSEQQKYKVSVSPKGFDYHSREQWLLSAAKNDYLTIALK